MNFIFGSAGFAKEVLFLIRRMNASRSFFGNVDFFVAADMDSSVGSVVQGVEVLSESAFFQRYSGVAKNCFVAVGSPSLKRKIAAKLEVDPSVTFPTLVDPSVVMDQTEGTISLGKGVILCAKSVLTTDIELGDFVHVNLDCTIGHDSKIGAYSTLSPGVHVSGRVCLGAEVFAGTGAVFLEELRVTEQAVVGAGAVVSRDLLQAGTYVGIPARLLSKA
jgi:sugar O-acyltransferase (sialic acid O-acetyltransferase NeuD family)